MSESHRLGGVGMSLKDLDLDVSYETNENIQHLIDTFYVPALSESTKYYRVAGFFSSTALVIASEGIEALVHNGGKMYLLISPKLSKEDYEVISKHCALHEDMPLIRDFAINEKDPDEHLQALAYLLDSGRLEIKIVVPKRGEDSLFHQKIGLFFDNEGNILSFSGSINETASAWLYNIEEFKVFRSWVSGQEQYVNSDLSKFLSYWKGEKKQVADVYDVPESVRQKILSVTPKDIRDLNIMRRYRKEKSRGRTKLSLFKHQEEAVSLWEKNQFSLLMEMATGTGKTRTALGCATLLLDREDSLLTIIATPQNTLSRQWKTDCEELSIGFDKSIIADGTNHNWRRDFRLLLLDLSEHLIRFGVVYTTHETASSDSFVTTIKQFKQNTKILFICDEVHAIATKTQKRALLDEYEYRVGLSATPERMFDEYGTGLIKTYFGNKSFEFSIEKALHTINDATGKPFLNRYKYKPIFVELTEEEEKQFRIKTRQIAAEKNKEEPDEERLQRLYDARADICKNAKNKFAALEEWIADKGSHTIFDTLLFVSDNQIVPCMKMLSNNFIARAQITERESASKKVGNKDETERQKIIREFKEHNLQVLVAMKCLDEGIDIPNARIALLMSNGTNPREYIQRIGRVIRQAPGKKESEIYDFIAYSPTNDAVISREARRANLIAKNAINYNDVIKQFERHGVIIDAD